MYLSLLNEEQKNVFLNIVLEIASADGDYGEEEKTLISAYCREMEIEGLKKIEMSIEELVKKANNMCDSKAKKIIIFECVGLAKVDFNFEESERKIINHMAEVFGIENEYITKCENIISRYVEFQNEINQLVIG